MLTNGKDSRWLQLEVCREYTRQRCTRTDNDCKFAHPNSNVEIIDGKVIACYDSIKERCNRETCKYFHPPTHLKEQLLINGRNHLALKNAMLQQMQHLPLAPNNQAYLANLPTSVTTMTTNPTVQTPTAHQLGQQAQPSLSTQQLVSQQLALQQLLAYSAYGQTTGALTTTAVPSLTDLQAYNIITALPPQQSNQGTASANLNLNNPMHSNHTNNTNHLVNTAALMRTYLSPGTSTNQTTIKSHPNSNGTMTTRQIIKLEVCREFQRCACKRSETECRYAHPSSHVNTTQDGSQVVVCSNFLKRGCTRDTQCRFFHPPSHLMDQVKQQQQQQQHQQLINQQLFTQQQLQQRAAMMIANQSLSTSASQTLLRKKRPREDILLGFPRTIVPLTKRPALEKMLLPGSTYEALTPQHSYVPFILPGNCIPRY